MQSLSRYEIYRLRDRGYPLDGENWMKVPGRDQSVSGLNISKVCNGDTLAVVMVPEDILSAISFSLL